MASGPPSKISHMLETCIYCKDIKDSCDFYTHTLGLTPLLSNERMACYPLGNTTLLLFALGETYDDVAPDPSKPYNIVPKHGPSSDIVDSLVQDRKQLRQHYCLAVETREDAERWEEYLRENKVKITGRNEWEKGGYSVYFDDPDGNVGEIASRGIWPHY
ncbi:hypothetical protein CLAFUW4_09017 [Fulvia fulva]|uniref:VOC domain-containing protein n=1 Tax=Passalora fulva TaxID=5499 RepID=A0A9Q8PFH3_PASFU|nr:uncharacterized protein CLAFUR5_09126 [Fulvia fulva]KAK4613940.1 hypothetical protein CLAFUR4_09023 [Fulvia fulva]KAK4614505.1 hypothetical protein CLAFUR0_09015 [Fulvia fulva]UJO21523.1 hypothetical protein CLAFUR5_09126 [Fulvia fulva]WPV20658.1 hypothetical protein CLAFUW4_09017 [Fulvia fulva]WPV34967.1 hypothetical protein CLAFUW7_09018 [Fulvia fulva]